MNRDKIAVVARRTRFEPPSTNALVANPASPVVLQGLMQIIASQGQKMDTLERKVDALATRPPQEVTVAPVQTKPKMLPGVEVKEDTAGDPPPTPRRRINRSRLLDIFD